jgi:hypothetical protein
MRALSACVFEALGVERSPPLSPRRSRPPPFGLRAFCAAASHLRLRAKASFTSPVGDRIATSGTFALKPSTHESSRRHPGSPER